MKLIIPIAGKSSRFNTSKPKWMLTHPNGRFMVTEAISGLNLNDFDFIYFIALKAHEEDFNFIVGLQNELNTLGLGAKTEVVLLDSPTACQPETVAELIKIKNLEGFIFIKDSDNYFKATINPVNQVCYSSLNDNSLINPKNKSYIKLDANGTILNIVEKNVIGPNFSVGGYGFEEAKAFVETFEKVKLQLSEKEFYISDLVFNYLLNNKIFVGTEASDYLDWGTDEDWNRYKKGFATLFIDLDGTLVENCSSHFPPYPGQATPLSKNISYLKQLKATEKIQIIITTARAESLRAVTEQELKGLGIPYDFLLMGLFHAQRIIVNDYSDTNPYKSCDSINLNRNSDNLEQFVKSILKV